MLHTKGDDAPMKITWYIKKDLLAYDLEFKTPEGEQKTMRFVPHTIARTLLITDPAGSFRYEVPVANIEAATDVKKGMTAKETGRGSNEPKFVKTADVEIQTPTTKTTMEYTFDIALDWTLYADFFGSDYSIAAMLKLNTKGFPYKSVTKDESGAVILRNELVSVKKEKISDSFFK
jgi:hypothetical protein